MKKPLLDRVVLGVIKSLKKGDPFVAVAIGDNEVIVKWADDAK